MSLTLVKPSNDTRTVKVKIAASSTWVKGQPVSVNDNVTTSTAIVTAAGTKVRGIIMGDITATDTDFAVARYIDVLRDEKGVFSVNVTSGSANDEQGRLAWGLNGLVVTPGVLGNDFRVEKFVDGTGTADTYEGTVMIWS